MLIVTGIQHALYSRMELQHISKYNALCNTNQVDWFSLYKRGLGSMKFTLSVSKAKPQLILSVALYYEIDDFFQDATNRRNQFIDVNENVVVAVHAGFAKHEKHYTLFGEVDACYIAMILDLRFKCELLRQELEEGESALLVISQLRAILYRQNPMDPEPMLPPTLPISPKPKSLESRLKKGSQGNPSRY